MRTLVTIARKRKGKVSAAAFSAIGLWGGLRWGYWLSLSMLMIDLAVDTISVVTGTELRAIIGIPIALLLLIFLMRSSTALSVVITILPGNLVKPIQCAKFPPRSFDTFPFSARRVKNLGASEFVSEALEHRGKYATTIVPTTISTKQDEKWNEVLKPR